MNSKYPNHILWPLLFIVTSVGSLTFGIFAKLMDSDSPQAIVFFKIGLTASAISLLISVVDVLEKAAKNKRHSSF